MVLHIQQNKTGDLVSNIIDVENLLNLLAELRLPQGVQVYPKAAVSWGALVLVHLSSI